MSSNENTEYITDWQVVAVKYDENVSSLIFFHFQIEQLLTESCNVFFSFYMLEQSDFN